MKSLCMIFLTVLLVNSISFAQPANWKSRTENADFIHRAIKEVSDVIVYDIYSPPVAGRTYAYISIAAYEILIHSDTGYISLAGQLHGLKPLPQPGKGKEYSYTLAAANAILTIGKALVISEDRLETFRKKLFLEFKGAGIPAEVFNNSIAFSKQIAEHILAWAAADKYFETRSMPNYAVSIEAGAWKPTPPSYMKGIEPNWNLVRTFVIDSAQQFKPDPPPSFSYDKGSEFYKTAFAVYNAKTQLTKQQDSIANFWDCNPFKMNIRGHVMFATKKISPGGHWLKITSIACKKMNAGVLKTAEAYACVSIVIADCFSSCWDEKYRSQVIRPETYINEYIDPDWMPLLQTPPFPEYTSGHSIVSAGASVFLTHFFGDDFSFTDSSEIEFGLWPRDFTSFNQAAEEAAISRFYGGIHYMPAIENGFSAGTDIGKFVVEKLKTKKGHILPGN